MILFSSLFLCFLFAAFKPRCVHCSILFYLYFFTLFFCSLRTDSKRREILLYAYYYAGSAARCCQTAAAAAPVVTEVTCTSYIYTKKKMGHGISGTAVVALLGYNGTNPWQFSRSLVPCCAVWTVEHQRVCSVGGKVRQLIFVVVIDC